MSRFGRDESRVKMRRPTIQEILVTYSMFQVRQGSTPVPITAAEKLDSVVAGIGSISLEAAAGSRAGDGSGSGSISVVAGASSSASTVPMAAAGSSSVQAAVSGDAPARRRMPGRWRRRPRILPHPLLRNRPMTLEELLEDSLDMSDDIYCFREEDKPAFRESKVQMARLYQEMIDMKKNGSKLTFRPLVFSDTTEEDLTAEEMSQSSLA